MDLDWFLEEYDWLQAVMDETVDDWVWEQAEKRFKDVWSIIHSRDPMHPTVVKGAPWLDVRWQPPSKRNKKPKPIPLPGSYSIGAPLSLDDDDDEKTDPGSMGPNNLDLWGNDPWGPGTKKQEPKKEKPKSEADRLVDFFFK